MLVALLGLGLRLWDVGGPSLWFDEALEVGRARLPLDQLLVGRGIDQDPPLYALFLALWLRLGDGEGWLRLPGALSGAVTILLMGRWAVRHLGRRGGLLTAACLAVAPVLVYHDRQVNQYAMLVLLATALLVAIEGVVTNGGRRAWWSFYLVSTVGLTTHYGLLFPLAGACLYLLTQRRQGVPRRRVVVCLAGLAPVVAWLWVAGLGQRLGVAHGQPRFGGTDLAAEVGYLGDVLWREVVVFQLLPFSGGPALIGVRLVAVVAVIGAVAMWARGGATRRAVGWLALLPLALTYPTDGLGWYPLGNRYALFTAPILLTAVAAGIDAAIARRPRSGALAGAAVVVLLLGFSPQLDNANPYLAVPREDVRPVVEAMVAGSMSAHVAYVYHGAAPALAYYAPRVPHLALLPGRAFRSGGAATEVARIRAASAARPVWLVLSHVRADEHERLLGGLVLCPRLAAARRLATVVEATNALGYVVASGSRPR